MKKRWNDYRLFWIELRKNINTIGAVVPSSEHLSREMVSLLRATSDHPRRFLEVGPGTGAVTRFIVESLGPDDKFDIVEINETFYEGLKQRFLTDPSFKKVAARCQVIHGEVGQIQGSAIYDAIVSAVPWANFSEAQLNKIISDFLRVLKPGGTISYMEYIDVIYHPLKMVFSSTERRRIKGVSKILRELKSHTIRRESVWRNLPPSWVHHVRPAKRKTRPTIQ